MHRSAADDLSPVLELMAEDPTASRPRPVRRRFLQLLDALEASGARYALCGAVAMGAHGVRRFTEDIDVLVDAGDLAAVCARLAGPFREVGREPPTGAPAQLRFAPRRTRGAAGVVIDVLVPVDAAEAWALASAVRGRAFGRAVDVVAPEALVVLKLRAYLDDPESAAGAKHRADALALAASVPLDRAALRRLASTDARLAVELERVLAAPAPRGRTGR